MTTPLFRRGPLLARCLFLYLPAVLIAMVFLGAAALFVTVATPLLALWSVFRWRKKVREPAPEPEKDTIAASQEILQEPGLIEGKRLLERVRQGEAWDLAALDAAITCFEQVRDKAGREGRRLLQAAATRRLGIAWWQARLAPGHDFGRCVRSAIHAMEESLDSLGERSSVAAAHALRELGVYHFAPGRKDDLRRFERSRELFEEAAEIFRWIPYEYALTQYWLGAALLRTQGARERNLERAIHCFRQARHLRLPEAVVRGTQTSLEGAVRELWGPAGTLALSGASEEAADPFAGFDHPPGEPALSRSARPRSATVLRLSALVLTNAAAWLTLVLLPGRPVVWSSVIMAGFAINLLVIPRAAEIFEAGFLFAFLVFPRLQLEMFRVLVSPHPERFADLFLSLVSSTFRAQETIPELRKTLQQLDRKRFPLIGLLLDQIHARLLCAFPTGETGESGEEAIMALRSTEALIRRRRLTLVRIFHLEALARAYLRRRRGDSAESAEEAIRILTAEVLPLFEYVPAFASWLARKRALLLLAEAYRRRRSANRRQDLELALARYREAFRIKVPLLRRLNDAVWSRTFSHLVSGSRSEMEQTLTLLSAWPRLTDAAIHTGLADVLAELSAPSDHWALTACAGHLRAAYLDLLRSEEMLQSSLRVAFFHARQKKVEILLRLAEVSARAQGETLGSTEARYRLAAREAMNEGLSELAVEALLGLGRHHYRNERYGDATDALAGVMAAMDRLRWQVFSVERRAELLRQNAEAFDLLILSAVRSGRLAAAIELSERSRSRNLIDLLVLRGVLPHHVPSAARQRLQKLMFRARDYEQQMRLAETNGQALDLRLNDELYRTVRFLQELLPSILERDPDFLPATQPLEIDRICDLARASASVFLLLRITEDETCALLVFPDGALDVVRTCAFTRESLNRLLGVSAGGRPAEEWLGSYEAFAMDATLDEVSRQLLRPVYDRLARTVCSGTTGDPPRLVIVPNRGTAILPLHACSWEINGTRRYLIDDFEVTYAPNLLVHARCLERDAQRIGAKTLFAAGNPTGDLPSAEWECAAAAAIFGDAHPVVRYQQEATQEEIVAHIRETSLIHLACHGRYLLDAPFASFLQFAEGKALTLGEILKDLELPHARLVVLSACETGLLDFREVADEHYGLATAFLCAGAATVWSTLWSVDDQSTALLMVRAYEGLRRSRGKAAALRDAQLWLRDVTDAELQRTLTQWEGGGMPAAGVLSDLRSEIEDRGAPEHRPFEHPYYWAPFQSTGGVDGIGADGGESGESAI